MGEFKKILEDSFNYLIAIYAIIIILVVLGLFSKYAIHFTLAAIIIALLSISITNKSKITFKWTNIIIVLLLIFILLVRLIPGTSVPLGYDTGLYKYGVESGLTNQDQWILNGGMEPGFLYLMELFKFLPINIILTYLLIVFTLLLGLAVYYFSKTYFDKETAILSLAVYAISVIQFRAFAMMYYKNIIAMATMLLAFAFLKNADKLKYRVLFITTAIMTGAIHRPTFYIFGLSYFFYAIITPYTKRYDWKELIQNVINGILIVIGTFLFYAGAWIPAITKMFSPVINSLVSPGESPGTFIDFATYQYSILPYIVFSIIGFIYLIKYQRKNILIYWIIINTIIVIGQLFFFNRFIIHLDLAMIILAGVGFMTLISYKRYFGITITIVLLICGGIFAIQNSLNTTSLISSKEVSTIEYLQTVEPNAYVLSTSKTYSTWLLGYSGRKVIAPGLFDYDTHTKEEWITFWSTENITEIKTFMKDYPTPLYVYSGVHQKNTVSKFPECFEQINEGIYKYTC